MMSTRGRVVIPKAIRQELGLIPGTRISVSVVDGTVLLTPAMLVAAGTHQDTIQGADLPRDLR